MFTDSYSTIVSLRNRNFRNNDLYKIYQILIENVNFSIKHCPSHVNIIGNEKADEVAAFQLRQEKLYSNCSRFIEHHNLKKLIQDKLAPPSDKKHYFNKYCENEKFIKTYARLVTDSNCLNSHLYKIGKSKTSKCKLCNKKEDSNHFINECSSHPVLRFELSNKLSQR